MRRSPVTPLAAVLAAIALLTASTAPARSEDGQSDLPTVDELIAANEATLKDCGGLTFTTTGTKWGVPLSGDGKAIAFDHEFSQYSVVRQGPAGQEEVLERVRGARIGDMFYVEMSGTEAAAQVAYTGNWREIRKAVEDAAQRDVVIPGMGRRQLTPSSDVWPLQFNRDAGNPMKVASADDETATVLVSHDYSGRKVDNDTAVAYRLVIDRKTGLLRSYSGLNRAGEPVEQVSYTFDLSATPEADSFGFEFTEGLKQIDLLEAFKAQVAAKESLPKVEDIVAAAAKARQGMKNLTADAEVMGRLKGRLVIVPGKGSVLRAEGEMPPAEGAPPREVGLAWSIGADGIAYSEQRAGDQLQVTRIDLDRIREVERELGVKSAPIQYMAPYDLTRYVEESLERGVSLRVIRLDGPQGQLATLQGLVPVPNDAGQIVGNLARTVVVRRDIGFPVLIMTQSGQRRIVELNTFSNVKLNTDLPEDAATYAPPEGAAVNDVTDQIIANLRKQAEPGEQDENADAPDESPEDAAD